MGETVFESKGIWVPLVVSAYFAFFLKHHCLERTVLYSSLFGTGKTFYSFHWEGEEGDVL